MDRALFLKPSLFLVALVASLGLLPPVAARAATQTIPGAPLKVFVSDNGNIQALFGDDESRVFYPPDTDEGDAGLFLGFPAAPLLGSVFGPPGEAQFATTATYTPEKQGTVDGSGTVAEPYEVVTNYKVRSGGKDYLEIEQTVRYVQGEKQFSASYTVTNVSNPPVDLQFRATAGADLYIEGDDAGTGMLDPGPPRFLAGVNDSVGRAGGIVEVPGSGWDAYEVAYYDDIWSIIGDPLGPGLDNSLITDVVDDGAGAQWDGYYGPGQGLAGAIVPGDDGASVTFDTVWRFAAVVPLTLDPLDGTQSAGRAYKIKATATEVTGNPMVGKTVRYTVAGANPGSGVAEATTNANGQTYVKYVGNNKGDDKVSVFVDLNNNGTRESNEPKVDAKVKWTEYKPPPPPISASIVSHGTYVVSKDGKVDVFLSCPSIAPSESGCEGDLTGRLSVRKHGPHKTKHHKKGKRSAAREAKKKKKKVKPFKPGTHKYAIGPAHYKLDAKQNGKVNVTVNPKALKRLKRMRRAIVSFTVRTAGRAPQSAIGTIRASR